MNICAPATALGGAIAIIRISGPDAITIVNTLFSKDIAQAKGQTLHYGQICSPLSQKDRAGNVIDDVLLSVFRAPHSYTGENAAEISCHASPYIVQQTLQALCLSGCRMAQPGEFTQRAFLNGKIDLSQAEAVADLIASSSAAAHRLALSQLKGGFSRELDQLREQLLHLTTLMELELDFSDHEELEFADRSEILALARQIDYKITALADSFHQGNALKNGIPVAIVGAPNVGKSTLLNALLKEEKAIVSDIPGTTRDYIEGHFTFGGHLFRFIDTAGLRQTTDEIESLGIERTKQKIEEAQIILWLSDTIEAFQTEPPFPDAPSQDKHLPSPQIIKLLTKIDQAPLPAISSQRQESLPISAKTGQDCLPVSAKTGQGLPALEARLSALAEQMTTSESATIVTNARHHAALLQAHAALLRVLLGLSAQIPTDLIAEDLRLTLNHLAEITGAAITSQEVLNNIWENFCIGK